MAVRFYDEALITKLQRWIKDPNMVILSPDESSRLFQIRADQTHDKPLQLPLIALSRAPDVELDFPHKKPMSFDGKMTKAVEGVYSYQLDAIPMRLQYQLDIYTRYADEGDEYMRNFVFNLVNHPRLTIHLPYNDQQLTHTANIDVLSPVSENSDIPQHLFGDQFTRWTMTLEIRDAYLFSVPKRDLLTLEVNELQLDDLTEETEQL